MSDSGLERLLRDLDPELHDDPYVFVRVDDPADAGLGDAFAVVREDEGATLVLTSDAAQAAGHAGEYLAARITLRVNSSLEDVGLTAAFSTLLAKAGISCNVIAGIAHDHLFVPYERGAEALGLLRAAASELPEQRS